MVKTCKKNLIFKLVYSSVPNITGWGFGGVGGEGRGGRGWSKRGPEKLKIRGLKKIEKLINVGDVYC